MGKSTLGDLEGVAVSGILILTYTGEMVVILASFTLLIKDEVKKLVSSVIPM